MRTPHVNLFERIHMKWVNRAVAAFFLIAAVALDAAPRRYMAEEDNQTSQRELRDTVEDVRHEVNNNSAELRMFQEKLSNQDSTVEALRQQMNDFHEAQKDLLKGNSSNLETRISTLEQANKGFVADLKLLKDHINESKTLLEQYGQKISRLEKGIETQNHNIANLESALRTMTEALQLKDAPADSFTKGSPSSSKIYRVKSGDSLGKISIENKTTIKALKELNPQLSNDKIVIGQTIQLP